MAGSLTERIMCPTLPRFAAAAAESDGVLLASLGALSQLDVRTRNTVYEITILDGGRVLVRGGAYFPVWTETQLTGSTLGGSFLKVGWVGRGFCMEFLHEGRRIVTTRAREISRQSPGAPRA